MKKILAAITVVLLLMTAPISLASHLGYTGDEFPYSQPVNEKQLGDVGGKNAQRIEDDLKNGKDPAAWLGTQSGPTFLGHPANTKNSVWDKALRELQRAYSTRAYLKEWYETFENYYNSAMEFEREMYESGELKEDSWYREGMTFEEYLEARMDNYNMGLGGRG